MSPVTVPAELIASIAREGLANTAIDALKNVVGLPKNLYDGLSSSNPETQGTAFVNALTLGFGGYALVRELGNIRLGLSSPSNTTFSEASFYRDGVKVDWTNWQTADGKWKWPDSVTYPDGAIKGTERRDVLSQGTIVDRFGDDSGRFLAPANTPFEQRSLPPSALNDTYTQYRVVKPLELDASTIAPWFGQEGGGTQFVLPRGRTVADLIQDGYLEVVKK
jgi:hypothetical protein